MPDPLPADVGDRDRPSGSADGPELLTIEGLAAHTGMTVRNIRSHRTAGLLPPPIVKDRVGYYGPEHVARLEFIRELQAEGFNLRGIKRLIEQPQLIPSELLTLKHVLDTPPSAEEPRLFTREDLTERFRPEGAEEAIARAVSLGLLQPLDDGHFEAPQPALLDIAQQVVSTGVPIADALTVIGRVQERCQAIGHDFVNLFLRDVWKPFAARDYPEHEWNDVIQAIEQLRPLSSQVVLMLYEHVMAREVDEAFGRELDRLAKTRARGA